MACIYRLTNKVTGQQYVGQTSKTAKTRWVGHKANASKRDTYLSRAIMKYGKDNFSVETLVECDVDQLDDLEIEWISRSNSLYPNGYNLRKGGRQYLGGSGGHRLTDEHKAKISATKRTSPNIGWHHTPEAIEKIRNANRSGRKLSDQARQNIRDGIRRAKELKRGTNSI